jgi:hypothetical protein
MSDEAKAPRFKMGLEDEQARPIEPDWSIVVSNQLTEITQNTRIIDNQLIMIEEMRKIIELWDAITKRQSTMVDAIGKLSLEMDKARLELRSTMMSIVQVPITVIIIAGASWLFYLKYIEEYTWIIIMAVSAFRYLGDSITGVVKLLGLRKNNNGGSQSK